VNGFDDDSARRPWGADPGEPAEAGAEATGEPTPEPRAADEPASDAASELQTPPEPEAPPSPEELADLRAKATERDEYLDLLKRTRADFANYQKRVAEDRKKWGAVAQRELLARLMGATDHCRLSAEKSKADDSAESLRDCIGLIWAELEKFLDSSGVTFVPTAGESFDPHRHEAVFMQERDDLADGTIIDEIRPGYEFGGQVIRPAQVVVSKRPKPPEPETVIDVGGDVSDDVGDAGGDAGESTGPEPGDVSSSEAPSGETQQGDVNSEDGSDGAAS
jgi:molecular chaperone GrpE